MNRKINISIPEPCHENWQQMSLVEKGRFCNSCQKKVYDFTHSSDREIIEKFNSEGNICGRFINTQLNRDLRLPKEKSSIWIAGVSGILSFLSLGNQEVLAQEKTQVEQTENKNISPTINNSSTEESYEINGIVTDESKIPLPGVNISVKGKDKIAISDLEGKFKITAKENDTLDFKFIGMYSESVKIISNQNITITMTDEVMGLTGIVGGVVLCKKRTFFGRIFHSIGNIFR